MRNIGKAVEGRQRKAIRAYIVLQPAAPVGEALQNVGLFLHINMR